MKKMTNGELQEFLKKHPLPKGGRRWLSEKTGYSVKTIGDLRIRMGLPKLPLGSQSISIQKEKVDPELQFQLDMEKLRINHEEKDNDKKYKQALKRIEALEEERRQILAVKKNITTFKILPTAGSKSEATAIWLASDWHVGEKVTLGQTNNINEYNPTLSKYRGEEYFRNGLKLTKMLGQDVEIKTIILALLGDFITGHLHSQAVETNYLPPAEEALYAQEIIASGIEYILENSKYDLIVPCASGNHGRTTKFSEFGSENGHSWEYFMYCNLRDHFRNEKRVTFIISEGAHTYIDVFQYPVRFLHGHDIKFGGGVGGITIPVNKAIAQWDKGKKAYLTCFGHFHQKLDGNFFVANGSMIGYNSFALSIKASAEPPAQQMFLIDRERGKTIVAPILFSK